MLENLNNIIIFGNSLKRYDLDEEYFAYRLLTNKVQVILDSDHMLHKMPLPQTDISIVFGIECQKASFGAYSHCIGAHIVPSVNNMTAPKLGH